MTHALQRTLMALLAALQVFLVACNGSSDAVAAPAPANPGATTGRPAARTDPTPPPATVAPSPPARSNELARNEAERLLAAHAPEQRLYLTSTQAICRTNRTIVVALAYYRRPIYEEGRVPAPGEATGDATAIALTTGLASARLATPFRYGSERTDTYHYRRWMTAEMRPPLELDGFRLGDQTKCRIPVGTLGPPRVTGVSRRSESEASATYEREWTLERALMNRLGAARRQFYCESDGFRGQRTECDTGAPTRRQARFRLFDDGWRLDD